MDDICLKCKGTAKMILPSENDACFCYEHGFDHHNISKNKLLRLSEYEFYKKIRLNHERINSKYFFLNKTFYYLVILHSSTLRY